MKNREIEQANVMRPYILQTFLELLVYLIIIKFIYLVAFAYIYLIYISDNKT